MARLPASPGKMAAASETLVAALAGTGDLDAFAELVRRREAWLRGLMRSLSGDPVLADELAERSLIRAWRGVRRLRDPARFDLWLKRIAVQVWRQHLGRQDLRQEGGDAAEETAASFNERVADQDLTQALLALPVVVRTCVVLAYGESMSQPEIAGALKLPEPTVAAHLRHGSARLATQRIADAGSAEGHQA